MSENTKIEWADHSWSPWRGCTKVSPGCANCYAEALSRRNPAVLGEWGKGRPRVLAKNWGDPMRWQKRTSMDMPRQRVFPSLCDWLDEEVPVEWLARFLKLIHDTPHLDWLLLTKRPENFPERVVDAGRLLADRFGCGAGYTSDWVEGWIQGQPPANVWVGASVEDQTRADERIPLLLQIPAAVRWLSVEPLIAPVDLTWALDGKEPRTRSSCLHGTSKVDWVVVGGESGPKARLCNVAWVRSIVTDCKAARVPVFVKQLGSHPICTITRGKPMPDDFRVFSHPKGGDPAEWPEDLRVREFPSPNTALPE